MGQDDAARLDGLLRTLAAEAAGFDAGDPAAAVRAGEALLAIFQPAPDEPPLLSRLNATYVKLASTVPKPPYPHGKFAPLTDVAIDLAAGSTGATTGQAAGFPPPSFVPRLGPSKAFRAVSAPEWWKSEPVFLVDHSRVTRRDVVRALTTGGVGAGETPASHLAELLVRAGWTGLSASPFGEVARDVPVRAAAAAAVRQIAHEVLQSAALRGHAARPG